VVSPTKSRAEGLSRRIQQVAFSPTVAMAQRAAALRARGERVLDFSVGEPDQPTPRHVAAAAAAALEAGRTRYTGSAGLPELREAVAHRYREDFGVECSLDEVVVTDGGKHALYCVCQCLLDPGDQVLIPSPYWPTFSETVRLAGGKPVTLKTDDREGFRVTARLVSRAIGPRTRALILNTPCNPTGAVVDGEELLALGRLARRRKLTLVYDDTYGKLLLDGRPPAPVGELRRLLGDRLVVVGTASKSYCMTGWRIGWVLGPERLASACATLISHSTQCPTSFAQVGAVAALTGSQQFVKRLEAEYRRRLRRLYPLLTSIPGVTCVRPGGGFYLFPNLTGHLGRRVPTTLDLSMRLLDEEKLAVVPGEGFDAPGHVRISFSRPVDELSEGIGRLAAFLARLSER
jgi:aspartate aminotransferase